MSEKINMIKDQQIDKLSDFFMRIAEGLMLGSFGVQAFTKFDILTSILSGLVALSFVYWSLKILELKIGKKS